MELIINTFGVSLNRDNEGFVVTKGAERQRIPVDSVSSIQISKGASITSDAVMLAIEKEIEIIFVEKSGRPMGRVWSPKYGSISTIRKGQVNFCYSHDFVKDFSKQYDLLQVIDVRTSDVSRACFLSYDKDAYYNENALSVDLQQYLNIEDSTELFDEKNVLDNEIKSQGSGDCNDDLLKDPDKETMMKIKQLLNPKLLKNEEKQAPFVPDELNEIMQGLVDYVQSTGIVVASVCDISYGKQIRFKMGIKQAEINLFYGKRGFKVVESMRVGMNKELNELMVELVNSYIIQL